MENLAQAGAFEINGAADCPNVARGDIATVDLRGLGTGNTLILLDGCRTAAHAVNQDVGSTRHQVTTVSPFAPAGIDRIEVLRDGASALYGSDATAGVVNTIISADFNEMRISLRSSVLGTINSADLARSQPNSCLAFCVYDQSYRAIIKFNKFAGGCPDVRKRRDDR